MSLPFLKSPSVLAALNLERYEGCGDEEIKSIAVFTEVPAGVIAGGCVFNKFCGGGEVNVEAPYPGRLAGDSGAVNLLFLSALEASCDSSVVCATRGSSRDPEASKLKLPKKFG